MRWQPGVGHWPDICNRPVSVNGSPYAGGIEAAQFRHRGPHKAFGGTDWRTLKSRAKHPKNGGKMASFPSSRRSRGRKGPWEAVAIASSSQVSRVAQGASARLGKKASAD